MTALRPQADRDGPTITRQLVNTDPAPSADSPNLACGAGNGGAGIKTVAQTVKTGAKIALQWNSNDAGPSPSDAMPLTLPIANPLAWEHKSGAIMI